MAEGRPGGKKKMKKKEKKKLKDEIHSPGRGTSV